MADKEKFSATFSALTGFGPMPWQETLYSRFVASPDKNIPACCDIPTSLGKTSPKHYHPQERTL